MFRNQFDDFIDLDPDPHPCNDKGLFFTSSKFSIYLKVDIVCHAVDDGEDGGLDGGRTLLQHLHQEPKHGHGEVAVRVVQVLHNALQTQTVFNNPFTPNLT